jgi:hypothetical protein
LHSGSEQKPTLAARSENPAISLVLKRFTLAGVLVLVAEVNAG